MATSRNFDWENVYKNTAVTEMPWYNPVLDNDLQKALVKMKLNSGTFLDLGTGPATQANILQAMGFEVTGVDISREAIRLAIETYKNVEFIQDNILKTKLSKKFDFIFDRGCFHVIDEDERTVYAKNVFGLLNDSGLLFLKCFSNKEPESGNGPHHISEQIIKDSFERYFTIEEINETEFNNDKNPPPRKALFITLKRR